MLLGIFKCYKNNGVQCFYDGANSITSDDKRTSRWEYANLYQNTIIDGVTYPAGTKITLD